MERSRGVLVIGITGGIGSGKGLATEFFRRHGAAVIDADEVSHQLTRPGSPLVGQIAAEFGREFVDENGKLDRRRLAQVAFGSPEAAARLNAVTHPAIMGEIEQMVKELTGEGRPRIICVVAPLLLEVGFGKGAKVDRVLVMTADEQERIRRVVERDGLTEEEVRQRIAAQMPVAEQQGRADWVVDTTSGREEALRQLEDIWAELSRL